MSARAGIPTLASFQQADLQLLRELGHEVRVVVWRGRDTFSLIRSARWADLAYCWNISYHTYLASLAAKRLACAVGGYEFANLPEVNYGNMISLRMRFITRRVWREADALLYVDESLAEEATRAFGHPGNAHYVPTGYDPTFWSPGTGSREDIVVSVCQASNPKRLPLKGVDLLLEAARLCPDIDFHIAGQMPPNFDSQPYGPNVRFLGWQDPEALRALYRRAKVYAQLSLHEGLPNAVCEAMLCGCVPVGTSVNGIPTAIGDAGYVVSRDPSTVAEAIRRAASDTATRQRARERIASLFSLDRRRRALSEILEALGP